jgi:chaperonin cofactor prefoldin
MEEQQKAVMSRLDERCEARIERIEKLERGQEDQGKTLDDLKKRIWMSSGAAATLSAIGTYIAAYLGMRHG